MTLGDLLFGADPSSEWDGPSIQPVTLDLRDKSLNGVPLDAPAEELRRLGKPSNKRPFRSGQFEYRQAGFTADIDGGRITYFGVVAVQQPDSPIRGQPFTLVLPDGASLSIDENTHWSALRAGLPRPEVLERDEQETIYTVLLDGHTLEVECSLDDHVQRINLIKPV